MIGTEVDGVGETHQRRVPHEIANASVQVGRGVIEMLAILDPDEVGELRRIVQAPVPPGEAAASSERRRQLAVLVVCDGLELEIDVVRPPWHAKRLVSLRSLRLGTSDERRVSNPDHTVGCVDLKAQGSSGTSGAVLIFRSGPEFGSARNPGAVRQRQHMAVAAVRKPESYAILRRNPTHRWHGAVRQRFGVLEGLRTPGCRDQFCVQGSQMEMVRFVEDSLSCLDPVRFSREPFGLD